MNLKNIAFSLTAGLLFSSAVFAKTEMFKADVDASKINWRGYKVMKVADHKGTINLHKTMDNKITYVDGKPTKGEFVVDMTTMITTDDMDDSSKGKLIGHLKSGDFFDVGTKGNEISKLELNTFKPLKGNKWEVSGNLIIKQIKNPVTFEVNVDRSGEKLKADGSFTFDRTKFKVMYGSKSMIGKLTDKVISDQIELKIDLVAELEKDPKS